MIGSNEYSPQLSPPRTFFCCWDWCRLTFSTVDELASHVRHNHIWKLQPMSKHEITRMRRRNAEESQSMSDSGSSVPVCHHEGAPPNHFPALKTYSFSNNLCWCYSFMHRLLTLNVYRFCQSRLISLSLVGSITSTYATGPEHRPTDASYYSSFHISFPIGTSIILARNSRG
jgi:hypothetical protein